MTSTKPATLAKTPHDLATLFAQYLHAGDIDGLASLYDEDARMVTGPGQSITGMAAIRENLSGFLSLKPTIAFGNSVVVENGDLALVHAKWTLSGAGPEGAVELAGLTSEVVRKGADGGWRYLIDDPFSATE